MFTSRGCPFKCNFCASPVMWNKVRLHSVDYVKGHILYVRKNYNVDAIMFQDDVFTMNIDRVESIGSFLKGLGIPYRCLARAADLTEEMVKLLKDTGCIEVGVGVESNNQDILDTMGKRSTIEQNAMALSNCKKAGLSVKAFLIIGSPGETHATILDTIRLLERHTPNDVDCNVLVPYPGTQFYNKIEMYDLKHDNTDSDKQYLKGKIEGYHPTVSTAGLSSEEIASYRTEIISRFSRVGAR